VPNAFGPFCFGLWFGLTAPLVLHVSMELMLLHVQTKNPSRNEIRLIRTYRFLFAPCAVLGILGVATVLGSLKEQFNFAFYGMLVGCAVYGLCFYLYRRWDRGERWSLGSDREIWMGRWELVRAGGRANYVLQHVIQGFVIGFIASVVVLVVEPRIGRVNFASVPSVLIILAACPLMLALYARWSWAVHEKQYHALRSPNAT
jgi:hypothetical protein